MTLECTASVRGVSGQDDYQRLYLPARLCRDSQYPLNPGEDVTVRVMAGVLLIGRETRIDDLVTNTSGAGGAP